MSPAAQQTIDEALIFLNDIDLRYLALAEELYISTLPHPSSYQLYIQLKKSLGLYT